MDKPYQYPVNQLLVLGEPGKGDWLDYQTIGLSADLAPELIRMATDETLDEADTDSLEVWAPLHAWRALGQLRSREAVEPLFALYERDDDWVWEEISEVIGRIGLPAIPFLVDRMKDETIEINIRVQAARGIERVAHFTPSVRDDCVAHLTRELTRHAVNDKELNAFLIMNLVDLKAVESLDVIRETFSDGHVLFSIMGDVEDVEIELGVRDERSTPADYPGVFEEMFGGRRPDWPLPDPEPYLEPYVNPHPKTGRNDPCPCGSGKKYKKCCLKTASPVTPLPLSSTGTRSDTASSNDIPSDLRNELMGLIHQGAKIRAIQRAITFSGMGLKEAKVYVDYLEECIRQEG